jgi:Flp pilus assembly protein TadG
LIWKPTVEAEPEGRREDALPGRAFSSRFPQRGGQGRSGTAPADPVHPGIHRTRRTNGSGSTVAGAADSRRRAGRGQALAEFAIVLPVLVALFFGIIDFGRVVAIHAATITASREAARYGAAVGDNGSGTARYLDCAGIRTAARAVTGALVTLPDANIRITYDDGSGTGVTAPCAPHGTGPLKAQVRRLDRVVVEVTATYEMITPLRAFIGPMTVVSVDRRTIVTRS